MGRDVSYYFYNGCKVYERQRPNLSDNIPWIDDDFNKEEIIYSLKCAIEKGEYYEARLYCEILTKWNENGGDNFLDLRVRIDTQETL